MGQGVGEGVGEVVEQGEGRGEGSAAGQAVGPGWALRLGRTLPYALFATGLLAIVVPRFTVVLVILLSLLMIATAMAEGQRLRTLFALNWRLLSLLAVALYLFLNATWSADFGNALGKAANFLVFSILTIAASRAPFAWQPRRLKAVCLALAAGAALGLLYLIVELASHQLLARGLYNLLPFTRPEGPKGVDLHGHEIVHISLFELNRPIAVLTLSFWPVVLCLLALEARLWRRLACASFALLAAAAIFLSEHQTSQIAIIVSVVVFGICLASVKLGRYVVLLGWLLAFLAVVPAAILAMKSDLNNASWLPMSARERIILWAYTAEHVKDHPIVGIGVNSTRALNRTKDAKQQADAARPQGYVYDWWAGVHAHNEFLQTWYELGVVGVILLMLAGAGVISAIVLLPIESQPYILAHFTAFMAVSASAWGMWQSWLMALAGLAAIYAVISALRRDDG
jgi:O-antigen ligase